MPTIIDTLIVFLFISFTISTSFSRCYPRAWRNYSRSRKKRKPVGSLLAGDYEISNGSSRGMLPSCCPDSATTKLDRSTRDRGAGRVPREDGRRAPGKILPSAHPRGTSRQRAFSLLIYVHYVATHSAVGLSSGLLRRAMHRNYRTPVMSFIIRSLCYVLYLLTLVIFSTIFSNI